MSIAVILNISDGLVFGVDSAISVSNAAGIHKVFPDGEKLFALANRIGVAAYGLAGLEGRSIGSFIREFERAHPDTDQQPIRETVERLRVFITAAYVRFAEALFGIPFDQIPPADKGILGLVVGGFSPGEFFSEVWNFEIPTHNTPYSAIQTCAPRAFSVNWFASHIPIERYIMGFDRNYLGELSAYIEGILGRPFTQAEIDGAAAIREKYAYRISLDALPIKAGIDYVRFLVELAIHHHQFASGHPIVGGKARVGVVTYKDESFKILES